MKLLSKIEVPLMAAVTLAMWLYVIYLFWIELTT